MLCKSNPWDNVDCNRPNYFNCETALRSKKENIDQKNCSHNSSEKCRVEEKENGIQEAGENVLEMEKIKMEAMTRSYFIILERVLGLHTKGAMNI